MQYIEWFKIHENAFSAKLNGHLSPPYVEYHALLKFINQSGKILDLGCGNGMLLKFICEFSEFDLIPFGIDKKTEVIDEAKRNLSKFTHNFSSEDVVNYTFKESFDIIICNDFYEKKVSEFDIEGLLTKCLANLNPTGRLIYILHNDVKIRNNIQTLSELSQLIKYKIKEQDVSTTIAILDKKDQEF